MKEYLESLWDKQIQNRNCISLPFFNEDTLLKDLEDSTVYDTAYLFRKSFQKVVEQLILSELDGYIVAETEDTLRIQEINFIDTSTMHCKKTGVKVSYTFTSSSGLILSNKKITFLEYPDYTEDFLLWIDANWYVFVDELTSLNLFSVEKTSTYTRLTLLDTQKIVIECHGSKGEQGKQVLLYFKNYKDEVLSYYEYSDIPKYLEVEEAERTLSKMALVRLLSPYGISSPILNEESIISLIELTLGLRDEEISLEKDILSNKRVYSYFSYLLSVFKNRIRMLKKFNRQLQKATLSRMLFTTLKKQVVSNANTQYLDDINPIAQLSHQRRINLVGSLYNSRVGTDMRMFKQSYTGFLDPIETPESGKIGLTLHKVLGVSTDEEGILTTSSDQSNLFNISASLIPAVSHNDPNRVLMGSNHIKQTHALQLSEPPKVSTGFDRLLYDKLCPIVTAQQSGVVTEVTHNTIYVENTPHFLPKPKIGNYKNIHSFPSFRYKVGDSVSKGANLLSDIFFKKGQLCLGVNTPMALMPLEGLNYEDSIVISDTLAHRLGSVHYIKKEIDLRDKLIISKHSFDVGTIVQENDILLSYQIKIRSLKEKTSFDPDVKEITFGISGILVDAYYTKKGNKVQNITKADSVFLCIQQRKSLKVGDKVSTRHASKGIISAIFPEKDMPKTGSGDIIHFIYNALGIPSRMNLGLLFEAQLSRISSLLSKVIESKSRKEIVQIFSTLSEITRYEGLKIFVEYIKNMSCEPFETIKIRLQEHITIEMHQFASIDQDALQDILEFLDPDHSDDGATEVYYKGKKLHSRVFVGELYVLGLKHRVDDKFTGMSISGLGSLKERPQKVGEMEVRAFEEHGAESMLKEIVQYRSDPDNESRILREIILSRNGLLDLENIRFVSEKNPKLEEFSKYSIACGVFTK